MSQAHLGLLGSLRTLVGTALEIAQTRLELLGCELEQEKANLFDALWWVALALVFLSVGLLLTVGFVLMLLQESYRLPALGLLTLLCVAAGWAMLRHARRRLHSPGGVFATSAAEIARDRAGLAAGD
jgi:uncharacterized membrane protein YqjE